MALLLRILSGPNAGATGVLADGRYSIGTSEDCDLVLADGGVAEHHLTITVSGDTVQVEAVDGIVRHAEGEIAAGQTTELPAFVPVMIGGTALATGPDDADWPAINLDALKSGPDKADSGDDEDQQQDADGAGESAPQDQDGDNDGAAPVEGDAEPSPSEAASRPERGPQVLAIVAVVLALFGLGSSAYLIFSPPGAGIVAPKVDHVAEVRTAISGLKHSERLTVSALGHSKVMIDGILPKRRDVATLRDTLRALDIQILNRTKAMDDLLQVVSDFLLGLNSPLTAAAGPDQGTVQISGFLPTAKEVDILRQLFDRDLPGVPISYDGIATADTIKSAFKKRLQDADLARLVRVTGTGVRLHLEGLLENQSQRRSLNALLDGARQDWGRFVAIEDQVQVVKSVAPIADNMNKPRPLAITEKLPDVKAIDVPRKPHPKPVPDPSRARVIEPRMENGPAGQAAWTTGSISRGSWTGDANAADPEQTFTIIVAGARRFVRDDQGRRFQLGDTLPDGFVIIGIEPGIVTARKGETDKRFVMDGFSTEKEK